MVRYVEHTQPSPDSHDEANRVLAMQTPKTPESGSESDDDADCSGPVAKNAQREAAKTKNEFADLANSRQTPDEPAATGQPLTRRQPLPTCLTCLTCSLNCS